MKIGIDLDEVLADFAECYLQFYNMKKNTNHKRSEMFSYYFEDIFKDPIDEIINLIYEMYESGFYKNMTPVKGSIDGVQKLKEKHQLFVITSRQKHFEVQTMEWIEKFFPDTFEKVILTNYASKEGKEKSKADICNDLEIDVFIDDQIRYCNACLNQKRSVFIFDCPWNKEGEISPDIVRVQNWAEIVQKIANLQKVY